MSQFSNIASTVLTINTHCCLPRLLAPVVEVFINHTMPGWVICAYGAQVLHMVLLKKSD